MRRSIVAPLLTTLIVAQTVLHPCAKVTEFEKLSNFAKELDNHVQRGATEALAEHELKMNKP